MNDELRPLRLPGGTWGAIRAALSGWWDKLALLTGLNILWAVALFTVVAAPPVTAALFYVARRVLEGDPFVGWESFTAALRATIGPAWRWALALVAAAAITLLNLWFYRDAPGLLWAALRGAWAMILLLWGTVNLFFWPIWFAQEPPYRTLRMTWRNALAFVALKPLPSLLAFFLTLLLATVAGLTGFLLGALFMVWTALLATATLAAQLPPVGDGGDAGDGGDGGDNG